MVKWVCAVLCGWAVAQGAELPSIVKTRDAAAAGDVQAQLALARAHASRFEYADALNWYQKAADKGNADALCAVADLYATGKPKMSAQGAAIAADPDRALRCYALAANAGQHDAQLKMGLFCREGKGMPKDEAEAYKWFKLAAPKSVTCRSLYLPDLARTLPRDKIDEGERRAAAFKPSAANPLRDTMLSRLRLQAITGSGNSRVALINGRALKAGDEAPIVLMGEQVLVRCISIGDQSVTVSAVGSAGTRELRIGGN